MEGDLSMVVLPQTEPNRTEVVFSVDFVGVRVNKVKRRHSRLASRSGGEWPPNAGNAQANQI